ncbi:hypothetical protein I5Q34_03865 [Streptomyces sp. AV19]|uniref:DUF6243 family protein n=1 Tax=Streptomyces sp. AV19 TaxID=2793068 RepID=UPI0018FE453A|nr:DUF6243 family protein [Streptomyces sp. AV19]MBH1933430.1 hypothetical protein [Streptomyces sp. AV19]MDG4532079.1 DUF6243 family protein [Streptomyces sp. AV19]
MTRGNGNLLGVGGTRRNLSRTALRGGGKGGPAGGRGADPLAQKRELLRTLREGRTGTTDV